MDVQAPLELNRLIRLAGVAVAGLLLLALSCAICG
jgi:hypothetical protein